MARRITVRGNIATLVFVCALTLAGMWILLDSGQGIPSDILIALSGVAAAWGLYFRLVDQGMGYTFDAERYELYVEQVGLVRQRFNAAGDDVRQDRRFTPARDLHLPRDAPVPPHAPSVAISRVVQSLGPQTRHSLKSWKDRPANPM